MSANEGTLSFRGYNIWYQIIGEEQDPRKLPLLCLHGGPGASHHYLQPLEAMANTGRRVIFYDQLGCGSSDRPSNPAMWTVEYLLKRLMSFVLHSALPRFICWANHGAGCWRWNIC